MDTLSRKLFKSRDARTKLRGMGGIMASSPELAQTVQQFQDGGDVDAGFGSNVEYTYSTFLAENNLNDTPQAREMFAKYKVYMDTREAPSDPKLFSPVGFDRAPAGLGDAPMTSAVEFDPTRQYTSPDMPSAPAELSEIGAEIPYVRQTSPAAPAAQLSTLDQLRGSVYSNNPLEDALAGTGLDSNVIGTSVIDPIMNRLDQAASREGMPSQTAADLANEMALRNREMASENAGRLTSEELLAVSPESSSELLSGTSIPSIDYSNLPIATLNKLADEGDDSAINQLRLNEISGLQTQSDISTGGDDLYMDSIMRGSLGQGRSDAAYAASLYNPSDISNAQNTIISLEEYLRLNPGDQQAEAQLAQAKDQLIQAETSKETSIALQNIVPSTTPLPPPPELLDQELGMDYVPEGETPVAEAPETGTAAVVTEDVAKKVADPKIQKKAAALAPTPGDTEDDIRTKYEARAKLFREILGEDEAGARNKGMDLAMIGLAIMSGQSPNALTNIGQGTLSGLQAMSAQDEAARERQRLVRTTALESVIDEKAAATSAAATAAEKELDRANVLEAARIRNSAARTSLYADDDRTYEVAADAARARASDPLFPPDDFLPGDTIESYAKRAGDAAVRFKNESKAAGFGPSGDGPSGSGASIRAQIQKRVDAAKENPAALAAIKQSLISKGIDPSKYGIE